MTVQLDHVIVPSRSQATSAKLLADILGVPWATTGIGGFSPVYVNEGLTLDFQDTDEVFPVYHFCFRVTPEEFDTVLARIKDAGIRYRSTVAGPMDMQVNAQMGNFYWDEPDGHRWELLTVSYARQDSRGSNPRPQPRN
jgi:hypothetical protein